MPVPRYNSVVYDASHTTYLILLRSIDAVWIGVGIVWAFGAVFTKRTERSQTTESRTIHLLLAAIGFFLVFKGPVGWRFLPESSAIALAGLALTIAGAGIAVWARVVLGANWSAVVTIKQAHQIIRRGPYAVVRHPIYSGTLLALLGTSLAYGEVRGLVGFALLF